MTLLLTTIDGETFITFARPPKALRPRKPKNRIYEVKCQLPRLENKKAPSSAKPQQEQVELPSLPLSARCPDLPKWSGWPVDMDSDCWKGIDPVSQVFRSHVVALHFRQEALHQRMACFRKEMRNQRSAQCRQLAQRYRSRRHKPKVSADGSPGHPPGPKTVFPDDEVEEAWVSAQAHSDSGQEDTAAKPLLSPRLLRFEQRCAARRRASGLQSIDLQALLKAKQMAAHSASSSDAESHDGRRPNSSPQEVLSPRSTQSWEMCLQLSRRHKIPIAEVRMMLNEFNALDGSGPFGELTHKEFEAAVRPKANIQADRPVPEYLLMKQYASADKDDNGLIDFEEFLLWSRNAVWLEELAVPSHDERELRRIARKYGLSLMEIDSLKRSFDKYDLDSSGHIDRIEFRDVVCNLMKVSSDDISQQQLDRYWIEAAGSQTSGDAINFEEFLEWIMKLGIM